METQILYDVKGEPAFAVIPYKEYLSKFDGHKEENTFPNDVAIAHTVEGKSLPQAWREYLHLTQGEIAKRLKITQAAYAQMEQPERKLRKSTRIRLSKALGINEKQLTLAT